MSISLFKSDPRYFDTNIETQSFGSYHTKVFKHMEYSLIFLKMNFSHGEDENTIFICRTAQKVYLMYLESLKSISYLDKIFKFSTKTHRKIILYYDSIRSFRSEIKICHNLEDIVIGFLKISDLGHLSASSKSWFFATQRGFAFKSNLLKKDSHFSDFAPRDYILYLTRSVQKIISLSSILDLLYLETKNPMLIRGRLDLESTLEKLKYIISSSNQHTRSDFFKQTRIHIYNRDLFALKVLDMLGADFNQPNMQGETPLHQIAKNGNANIARFIIPKQNQIDCINFEGKTALLLAIESGNYDLTEILLKNNASLEISNDHGNTPLHIAVTYGNLRITKLLLMNHANPNALNLKNSTPLILACNSNYPKIAELLLSYGANPNLPNSNLDRPILWAVIKKSIPLVDLLLLNGANPNVQNRYGYTPLFVSVASNNINIFLKLLKAKANPNLIDFEGLTPLHKAAMHGHTHFIYHLLSAGANIDAENSFNQTPIYYSIHYQKLEFTKCLLSAKASTDIEDAFGFSPLLAAIFYNDEEGFIELISSGCDVNKKTRKNISPLLFAIQEKKIHLAKILLQIEADYNDLDAEGNTIFHLLIKLKEFDLIKPILNKNKAILDLKNNQGETILHLATKTLSMEHIKFLINLGADPLAQDYLNVTALQISIMKGNLPAYKLFIQHLKINYIPIPNETLMTAIIFHKNQIVESLLSKGLNPNFNNFLGETLLEIAAKSSNIEAFLHLLAAGSNPNTLTSLGFPILNYCSSLPDKRFIKHLLRFGSNPLRSSEEDLRNLYERFKF
jgi:ankyrin repeat protein